jgi:hypothetical protein
MAGFEVITHGRFWVIAEAAKDQPKLGEIVKD